MAKPDTTARDRTASLSDRPASEVSRELPTREPPPEPMMPAATSAADASERSFVAASAGIDDRDIFAWRFDRDDRCLIVVTTDGRKLVVDLEAEAER